MDPAKHKAHSGMQSDSALRLRVVSDRLRFGTEDSELPDWVKKEIRERNLVTGDGEMVSFCGLMARGKSDIWVFLPRGVIKPASQIAITRLSALVTSSIERYARQSATRVNANSAEDGFQGSGQISVIRELLEDYRINGLYVTSTRQFTVNQGKTDWKRTISNVTPFPSSEGMPVFPTLLGSRRNFSFDNIVTTIHSSVIFRLDQMFGWWITGDAAGSVARDLDYTFGLLERESYCLAMLRKERAMVYSDRNLRLINNLIKYFEQDTAGADGNVVIGVRDFHWAWEHMLGAVLPLRTRMNQHLPVPVYQLNDGSSEVAVNSSMRTDIILVDSQAKKAVVVDAKYYAATNIGNSPGWGDLVKQFFYAKALKIIRPEYEIGNVFLFPGANGKMASVSVKNRNTIVSHDDVFPPVRCIYASPETIMSHYIGGTNCSELGRNVFERSFAQSAASTTGQ